MEEKEMRELSLEEMDKVSGGYKEVTCARGGLHDWINVPGSDIWRCSKCNLYKSSGGMNGSNSQTAPAD